MVSITYLGIFLLAHTIGSCQALFEGCNRTYILEINSTATLQSPYFPAKYPIGTSCLYNFMVPLDYEILAECMIDLDKSPTACTTEYFYVSTEGDKNLNGAEQICGTGKFTRTSLFRELALAYSSSATSPIEKGTFNCTLTVRPQACNCGWSSTIQPFIVGGTSASFLEYNSVVALFHPASQTVYCDGTIISHYVVLTAAHCTQLYSNPNEVRILAGYYRLSTSNKYQVTYAVRSYIQHTGYNPANNANDIALLMTSTPIQWSRGVGPICLPLNQLNNLFEYYNVYVVGWGTTQFGGSRADTLQKAAVNTIPNSNCRSVYPDLVASQICTYFMNRDSCQFDSGGPVIYQGTRQFQIGIISSGIGCGSGPGVNTRVTSFINWIRSYPVGTLCYKPLS